MPNDTRRLPAYFRWLVLVMMSLICFAQYYIYDSVTPLATLIKDELGFSGAQYGLLFTFYSLPNVFLLMVVVAGVMVDRLGIKASGLLYSFMCLAGAAVTALGASSHLETILGPLYGWLGHAFLPDWSPALKVMLLGRMLYGVGAEGILVVNNKALARWFTGKELAFAFGLNLTVMRLGTFLALSLQAPMAQTWGLRASLWIATVIMGVGAATFFIYMALERAAAGRPGAPADTHATEENLPLGTSLLSSFRFPPAFWYITLLCVTFYSAVFPFQAYAPDILVQKFGYSVVKAGFVASLLILGTMICTPLFGWIIDRFGKRATFMILGAALLIPSHLLLGYTHVFPGIPIFAVGVAMSLVPAALWAAIPMMVPERRLGVAFGIVGWVQNFGLMLFPWVAGRIADAHTTIGPSGEPSVDYTSTMLLFVVLGVCGLTFSFLLKWADAHRREGPSIESVMLHQSGSPGLE